MLIVQLNGDLGTQMFQYAVARNFSLVYDCELLLDCSLILKRLKSRPDINLLPLYGFNTSLKIAGSSIVNNFLRHQGVSSLLRFPELRNYKVITESRQQITPNFIYTVAPPTLLKGNFYDEFYFKEHIVQMISDFTFKEGFKFEIDAISHHFQLEKSIGIILTLPNTKNLPVDSDESINLNYYHAAIAYFSQEFPLAKFVFFTNLSEPEIEAGFGDINKSVFVLHEGIMQWKNLALMSKCMHLIADDTAISWWAAWLNNGTNTTVVIPQNFSINKPELTYKIKGVVQNWIKM